MVAIDTTTTVLGGCSDSDGGTKDDVLLESAKVVEDKDCVLGRLVSATFGMALDVAFVLVDPDKGVLRFVLRHC